MEKTNHLEDLHELIKRLDGNGNIIVWSDGHWKMLSAVDAKEQLRAGLATFESPTGESVPGELKKKIEHRIPSHRCKKNIGVGNSSHRKYF